MADGMMRDLYISEPLKIRHAGLDPASRCLINCIPAFAGMTKLIFLEVPITLSCKRGRVLRLSRPLAGESWREVLFSSLLTLSIALFSIAAIAEELVDPTRPPALIAAPVAAVSVEAAPAGLQSIIISKTRRAAIIDGETVELGGKHGDVQLIEVNEGSVVLRGVQGRQVMTLFPGVKMTSKKEMKTKPQPAANKVRTGKQKVRPVAHEEKK